MRRKLATKLIAVGMAAMLMAGCGAEKTASTSASSQDAKTETGAGGSGEETPAQADRGGDGKPENPHIAPRAAGQQGSYGCPE